MTHEEQALQLAKNAAVIAARNKAECKRVDRFHEYANSRRSTTGIGSDRKDGVTKYHAPTIHDKAADNPLLAQLLRDVQRKYMP